MTATLNSSRITKRNVVQKGKENLPVYSSHFNDLRADVVALMQGGDERLYETTTAITALAGGGRTGATQLAAEINNITTCATAGDSVQLHKAQAGLVVTVINNGAEYCTVYTQESNSDTINGAAATVGEDVYPGESKKFYATSASTWVTSKAMSLYTTSTGLTANDRMFYINHNASGGTNAVIAQIHSAATDETTVLRVSSAAMVSGVVLNLVGTTGMTTGSVLRATSTTAGAVATNGIFSFNASGAFTSTAATLGAFHIAGAATAAGTIASILGGALTTGVGLYISEPGTGMTSGSLLRIASATTGAVATNGIVSIRATGAYTSTSNAALVDVLASATTAGTVVKIDGAALTTGTGVLITSAGVMTTTGNLLTITANGATTAAGVVRINANGLTSGIGQVITSSATAITGAGRMFLLDHSGASSTSGVMAEFKTAATDETILARFTASGAITGRVVDIVAATMAANGRAISIDCNGATAIYADGDINNRSYVTLFDDFLYQTIVETHTDWALHNAAGGADPAIKAAQEGGVLTCNTTGGATGDKSQVSGATPHQADSGGLVFEAKLHIDAVTTARVCVGFTDVSTLEGPFTISGADAVSAVADDAVCFVYDTTAATDQWFACAVDSTAVDSGSGTTGTAPSAGVDQTLRIEVSADGATCTFYIDGTQVAQLTGDVGVSPDVNLFPTVYAEDIGNTAVNVDLDYIFVGHAR